MNEDGTLKIEQEFYDHEALSIFHLKCNYCSSIIMEFDHSLDEETIKDKKAIIVCSGCKGKLI